MHFQMLISAAVDTLHRYFPILLLRKGFLLINVYLFYQLINFYYVGCQLNRIMPNVLLQDIIFQMLDLFSTTKEVP